MDIVVVAKTKGRLDELKALLNRSFPESAFFGFVDPMLAVQFIFGHPTDRVFAESQMKRPSDGERFVRVLRQKQPDMDITLICPDGAAPPDIPQANRVISKTFLRQATVAAMRPSFLMTPRKTDSEKAQ